MVENLRRTNPRVFGMTRPAYIHSVRHSGTLKRVMMQTAKIMRMSGHELHDFLTEMIERNPFVEIERGDPRLGVASDSGSGPEMPSDTQISLYRHLARQFPMVFHSDADMKIALAFLQEIDPNGWLTVSVKHVSKVNGFALPDCERVFEQLRSLEPAGVFARDLKDCVRLQAKEQGLLDDTMAALIDHLDELVTCELATLARRLNIDPQDLVFRLNQIRRMDPKPGRAFGFDTVFQTDSDVVVSATKHGLTFELSRSSFPIIRTSAAFGAKLPQTSTHRDELNALAREARELRSAVEMRKSTTLYVVAAIFARQRAFLDHGFTALCPMRMGDIADDIGVSEATVSRIVSGLSIQCPVGRIAARALFCSPVSYDDQPRTRHVALQMIKALISAEDKRLPLSDRKIAALLQQSSLDISRRTITKYRHALGLEAPGMRRKTAELSDLTMRARAVRDCRDDHLQRPGRNG